MEFPSQFLNIPGNSEGRIRIYMLGDSVSELASEIRFTRYEVLFSACREMPLFVIAREERLKQSSASS